RIGDIVSCSRSAVEPAADARRLAHVSRLGSGACLGGAGVSPADGRRRRARRRPTDTRTRDAYQDPRNVHHPMEHPMMFDRRIHLRTSVVLAFAVLLTGCGPLTFVV